VCVAGDPLSPLHVATKAYVDQLVANATSALTFDAQLATGFSHPGGAAWVKVPGFTTVRVPTIGYNSGLSRFVAPQSGNYLFVGQIAQVMGPASAGVIGTFGKNGKPVGNWVIRNVAAGALDFMPMQSIIPLVVGDYVEMMFNCNSATSLQSGYSSFSGTRL
jgi:hypothetical protein